MIVDVVSDGVSSCCERYKEKFSMFHSLRDVPILWGKNTLPCTIELNSRNIAKLLFGYFFSNLVDFGLVVVMAKKQLGEMIMEESLRKFREKC